MESVDSYKKNLPEHVTTAVCEVKILSPNVLVFKPGEILIWKKNQSFNPPMPVRKGFITSLWVACPAFPQTNYCSQLLHNHALKKRKKQQRKVAPIAHLLASLPGG